MMRLGLFYDTKRLDKQLNLCIMNVDFDNSSLILANRV